MDLFNSVPRYFTIRKMEEKREKWHGEKYVDNASTGGKHAWNMHSYTSYVVLCVRERCFFNRHGRLLKLGPPEHFI